MVCRYDGPLSSWSHCLLEVGFFKLIEGWACEELITGPKVIRVPGKDSHLLPPQGAPGWVGMTCLLAEWETPKKPGQHSSQRVDHQACGLFLVEEVQGRMDATSCHPLDSTFEVVFI